MTHSRSHTHFIKLSLLPYQVGESNQMQLSCGQRPLFQAEMAYREMQMGGHKFPPHPQHMVFHRAVFSFVHSGAAWHFHTVSSALLTPTPTAACFVSLGYSKKLQGEFIYCSQFIWNT